MIADYFRIAKRSLLTRKLRSFLTLVGIFIGIATVVSIISLGQGLQAAVNDQFEQMGGDKIMVSIKAGFFGVGAEGIELTEDDLDAIKQVKEVKLAGGFIYKLGKIKYGDETKYNFVIGLPQDESRRIIQDMSSFKIEDGRDLKKSDRYKVVVGIRYLEEKIFDKSVGTKSSIEIEDYDFDVVGVAARIGNPSDDSQVYIPLETARDVLNEPTKFDMIMAQVNLGTDIDIAAEKVERKLRKVRDVKEGEEDFVVQTSDQLRESFNVVFAVIAAVLVGLAMISLIVGGVGIMNTMYTAVLDRTREIGVMKAIGATNFDIAALFLVESGILGLIGGAIGILIGVTISKTIESASVQAGLYLLKISFPWYLVIGALFFSFIVGAVSGLVPALKAAKLKPVEALRYE